MNETILHRKAFILVLSAATLVMALSMLALSPVASSLMVAWNVSFAQIEWLTTVFLLVMCLSMLVSPWLFNRICFHKLILMILGCFMIGTILLSLAPWYLMALVGRVLEATALGAMFPLYQSALLVITTGSRQIMVMGIAGAVMSFAIVGGPAVIELALVYINWRVFYGLLALLTILVGIGSFTWITNIVPVHVYRFDWYSLLYSLGIFGLLYLLNVSWTSREIPLLTVLVISLFFCIMFINRQLYYEHPLLQIQALRYWRFDLCLLLSGMAYASLIDLTTLLPLFYQEILGQRGFEVSLNLLIPALTLVVINLIISPLTSWLNANLVMVTGMTLLDASFLLFVIDSDHLTTFKLLLFSCLTAIGSGLVLMPATTQGSNFLPTKLVAHGITIITVTRQLFGSLSTALITFLLTISTGKRGFTHSFTFLAFINLIVLVLLIFTALGGSRNENN